MADGEVTTIATRALTVGGVLKAVGLHIDAADKVEPASWSLATDGLVINVERAARVLLTADGKTYSATTGEKDPQVLLAQWGLRLNDGDRLVLAGETLSAGEILPDVPFVSLDLRRPVQIKLIDGQTETEFMSSAPTLGEALQEEGVDLLVGDMLETDATTLLNGDISVTLVRAEPLLVIMGDSVTELHSAASTVGDALADAGIALQTLDRSEPAEDEPIPADRRIRVIRVSESVVLEQETLPHEIEWQEDPEAELDTLSVVQEGQDGVSALRVRVRQEEGEEVSRSEEDQRIIVEAKDQINGYGTQIVLKTTVVDGVEIEYYRAVTVFTTWYSPCNSAASTCLYGTSSGLPVQRGTIATYLNWYLALKFTNVYIPGYGVGAIGDNNGANSNGREFWMDLAFSEDEVAAAGGSPWPGGYVTVYFTTPVPAYVPPVWPP